MQNALSELTVLLVEPSPMQARLIAAQLERQGIAHIVNLDTGAAALAALRTTPDAMVISALYLPDMTGTDLVHAMRAQLSLGDTPFILVSSETRPQVLEPVRQSGVCGILPKPFSEAQLAAALRATLDLLNTDDSLEAAGLDLEHLRVLIVDDSPMARKFIRQVLGNLGVADFLEAGNGLEAVGLLEETQVDLVVTDYNMPEMDGRALVEYIRTQSWQNSVPVMMVTSESSQGRLAAVQELGVVGLCDKPFEPRVVKQLLANLLGGPAPH